MPIFQELPAEVVQGLLEGYENELEPEQNALDAFYRQCQCPRCSGQCEKVYLGAEHAFGGDSAVPRSGLKCKLCDCVFDPHSGLIVELGNPGNIGERMNASQVPWVSGGED